MLDEFVYLLCMDVCIGEIFIVFFGVEVLWLLFECVVWIVFFDIYMLGFIGIEFV